MLTALVIIVVSIGGFAQAQDAAKGTIIAPASTLGQVPGVAVRTPLYIFKAENGIKPDGPPASAENPGSVACIYGVTPPTNGCPKVGSPVATGGAKAIAVVDYGHNSTLQADFNAFNTQYGLPAQTLQFICDCSSCPSNNGTGWDLETALDTEYAHAMAPQAQIIVSQFCSDPFQGGTTAAEYLAGQAVATPVAAKSRTALATAANSPAKLDTTSTWTVPLSSISPRLATRAWARITPAYRRTRLGGRHAHRS